MNSPDDDFFATLLSTFREDAEELLTSLTAGLIKLEQAGENPDPLLIEEVFRTTHSLKGAARAVNLREIESVCLNLENIFSLVKRGEFLLTADDFDLFHKSVKSILFFLTDREDVSLTPNVIVQELRALLAEKKGDRDEGPIPPLFSNGIQSDPIFTEPGRKENSGIFKMTQDPAAVAVSSTFLEVKPASLYSTTGYSSDYYSAHAAGDGSTVRIASKKLDRLIIGSDELLTTRLFLTHRMEELSEMMSRFSLWRWNHSLVFNDLHLIREILFGTTRIDLPPELGLFLERVVDFLKYDREFVTNLQHDLTTHIHATDLDRTALESSTTEIAELIHNAVLVPVSSILGSVAGIIREGSRNLGKQVEFRTEGGDIEVDRRILDMLKVPLMHIIHNSIDHGIEYPDQRVSLGKPEKGLIKLKITPHSGSKVGISITDDGRGIDRHTIRLTAAEKGLLTEDEKEGLTDEEAIWLIFRSGLTTSPIITDLSGRGLGLAIVEDTITRMGGEVLISSEFGKGTTFSLILPVRVATLRGLVVRSGSSFYVIPVQQILQVIRINRNSQNEPEKWVISLMDELIPIISLTEALGCKKSSWYSAQTSEIPLVIIAYGAGKIACTVDEVIQVQEIVVRPLGSQLKRVKRITGAAVLGDGKIALVLDPPELIQEGLRRSSQGIKLPEIHEDPKTVLIVEDSVTSRALLRNTLEKEGFTVITAVDGMEAFSLLKDHDVDMVVSDVDMPRMNGFTLTEKIRSDERLWKLPVILVTALDSPEDREHGISSGASAYILKGSFEKNELIKTVKALIRR